MINWREPLLEKLELGEYLERVAMRYPSVNLNVNVDSLPAAGLRWTVMWESFADFQERVRRASLVLGKPYSVSAMYTGHLGKEEKPNIHARWKVPGVGGVWPEEVDILFFAYNSKGCSSKIVDADANPGSVHYKMQLGDECSAALDDLANIDPNEVPE